MHGVESENSWIAGPALLAGHDESGMSEWAAFFASLFSNVLFKWNFL
jgi:hypothetical protein